MESKEFKITHEELEKYVDEYLNKGGKIIKYSDEKTAKDRRYNSAWWITDFEAEWR